MRLRDRAALVQLEGLKGEFSRLLGIERRRIGKPVVENTFRNSEVASGSAEPLIGTCFGWACTSHAPHHGTMGTYDLSGEWHEIDVCASRLLIGCFMQIILSRSLFSASGNRAIAATRP